MSLTSASRLLLAAATRGSGRALLSRALPAMTVAGKRCMTTAGHATSTMGRVCGMSSAAAAEPAAKDMFCFQCEQTKDQKGCTAIGVCGKNPEVAAIQDVLVQALKGISQLAHRARQLGAKYTDKEIDRFFLACLFSTLTNVNFDADRLVAYLKTAHTIRDRAAALYKRACQETGTAEENLAGAPASFSFSCDDRAALLEEAKQHAIPVRQQALGEDVVSLQELITYGLKGCAAYADHAASLGVTREDVFAELHAHMNALTVAPTVDLLVKTALAVGATNYKVMEMLDGVHVKRFGHPTPTKVSCKPVVGKSIVVSGHDLPDLEALLKQTEGKGINVYTHGEMLPAHGYPELRKYKHLVGHYGGGWQLQKIEFADFKGAVLMTSNCIVEPKKAYAGRIFTRHSVGWPGVPHITGMDFSQVIECAQKQDGFSQEDVDDYPERSLNVGFARNALITNAGTIVELVKAGKISRFFVIGGCDGSESERSYFRDLAKATPKDSLILTAGCGKYKINSLPLGTLAGLPRVLDCGQCNDSYSAIQVALALAKAFNTDVNSLPLSFAISWFEQKAVAVLLTLLHLGIKNIRLGPHLPAFVSPNVLNVLVSNFQIKRVDFNNVQADLAMMMQNK